MPSPVLLPLAEALDVYIPDAQPDECSSSSSGITCTQKFDLDSGDDPDVDEDEMFVEEVETSDFGGPAWTDSKHSSYLSFMEQNFVKDLYDREYCALDVCGQESHRRYRTEHTYDADSAESQISSPFGSLEFKVWENGKWTWRTDTQQRRQPWTLLSNPWVKHFRTRKPCTSSVSKVALHKNGQNGHQHQQLDANDFCVPTSNSGSHDHEDFNQLPQAVFRDSGAPKRMLQVDNEHPSLRRHQPKSCMEGENVTIGVFGELCKRSNEVGNLYSDAHMLQCADG